MKLYTEKQVLDIILDSFISEYPVNANDILSTYTPIELPGDEEINREFPVGWSDYGNGCNYGAKWMKEQIIKQSK